MMRPHFDLVAEVTADGRFGDQECCHEAHMRSAAAAQAVVDIMQCAYSVRDVLEATAPDFPWETMDRFLIQHRYRWVEEGRSTPSSAEVWTIITHEVPAMRRVVESVRDDGIDYPAPPMLDDFTEDEG